MTSQKALYIIDTYWVNMDKGDKTNWFKFNWRIARSPGVWRPFGPRVPEATLQLLQRLCYLDLKGRLTDKAYKWMPHHVSNMHKHFGFKDLQPYEPTGKTLASLLEAEPSSWEDRYGELEPISNWFVRAGLS